MSTSAPNYKKRDLVDIFRKPDGKDVSGWAGPCTASDDSPAEGNLTVKIKGIDRPYRYGDVRYSLFCTQSSFAGTNGSVDNAVAVGSTKSTSCGVEAMKPTAT